MHTDKTTLTDLGIFDAEDKFSVFNKIDLSTTGRGKEQLRKNLLAPLQSIELIREVQQTITLIGNKKPHWPHIISNGTVMVVERFYESDIEAIPERPSSITAMTYKILHSGDFSLVKYSVRHIFDFLKGMQQLVQYFLTDDAPDVLKKELTEAKKILAKEQLQFVADNKSSATLKPAELLQLAHFVRQKYRLNIYELLKIFARMDAWYGMSRAIEKYHLRMPVFETSDCPFLEVGGLHHILLDDAISYDVQLNREHNFLFLTGANMAGKSTFIKACGIAVYLAHTGIGVPATQMTLSYLHGIISNINVIDNIAKGESYFFNEVQRIKSTIEKLGDGKDRLILIDELFKGTNVQDAMKCSSTVIEGLLKIKNAVFILSTHLYEIGEDLKGKPNILFNYFETAVKDDQLHFSYRLKEGISNDRLGYIILKQEGVVKLLEGL